MLNRSASRHVYGNELNASFRLRRSFLQLLAITAADNWSGEAVTFSHYSLYKARLLRIVSQRDTNFANGGIDAVIDINENVCAPEPPRNFLTANQFSLFLKQEDEELHRALFETQGAIAPLQQIPRRIKCELAKMEQLRRTCPRAGLVRCQWNNGAEAAN